MYQTSSHDNDHHNLLNFHHNFPLKQYSFLKFKEKELSLQYFLSLVFNQCYLSIKRGKTLTINIF